MAVVAPGRETASVAMGRMEVVARELSTDGMYVSRSLVRNSSRGVLEDVNAVTQ